MHVKVKELPECLQAALKSESYHKADISVEAKETASIFDPGSEGRRGFVLLVHLPTGNVTRMQGSWGGSNMFNPSNAVDLDTKDYALPIDGAVIRGSEGYQGTFATITLHPGNVVPWLPAASDLTESEKHLLAQFRSLKPAYRMTRGHENVIDRLVSLGYLKRSKNGATQITTSGKNACEGVRGY